MGEWIQQLIDQLGYVGIAILMFAETVFPPLPSEVIMPLAGLRAARGSLSLAGAVAAGRQTRRRFCVSRATHSDG